MNTITNDQIKEAYKRPELLKELFPNAFKPVLEVGKWYFITLGIKTAIFNFSGQFDVCNYPLGYGFDYDGKWNDLDGSGWGYDTIRPATTEEVEKALINEAVKRGFKEGKIIKNGGLSKSCKGNLINEDFSFDFEDNCLWIDSIGVLEYSSLIFKDGKWAEIIQETELELTLDQIAEKFGVDKVKIKS